MKLAPGIYISEQICKTRGKTRQYFYVLLAALLTFLVYVGYHMCRVPIGIIENEETFLNCTEAETDEDSMCSSWILEMENTTRTSARKKIANMKTIWGFAYAFCMFPSGYLGDHMDLRHFLSGSTLLYAVTIYLFGAGQTLGIRSIWYYYVIMALQGVMSSTGWPGVVAAFGPWLGQSARGTLMGIWSTNAFVGNIIGRSLTGDFLKYGWGNSFILLALILGILGLLTWLLLVSHPSDLGYSNLVHATDKEDIIEDNNDKEDTAVGFLEAVRIPGVIEFAMCLFASKFVVYIFLFWLPDYVKQTSGVGAADSGFVANFFEYGGIIGGITSGILVDLGLGGGLVCGVSLALAIPSMLCYQELASDWCLLATDPVTGDLLHDTCLAWHGALLVLVGILVSGPYALITSAISAELGTHEKLKGSKALATVSAIINGTGSVGGAIGPFTAGQLPAKYLFPMVMVSDSVALVFLARIITRDVIRVYRNIQEKRNKKVMGRRLSFTK